MAKPLNVLLLYDAYSTFTQTVVEHLRSFGDLSRHNYWYAHGMAGVRPQVDLEAFDVVVIHYSVRLISESLISPVWARALQSFTGAKLLFIQDEYDATECARRWMERLRLDVVFTCVPEKFVESVYPSARFPNTRFLTTLTGFVPPRYEASTLRKPVREREIAVAYRGRPLPYWYGKLGREKLEIGVRMKKLCSERGVAADIEWTEEARIYGERWYEFLASSKTTLGTESGTNVFDEHGEIQRGIRKAHALKPDLTFEEAWEKFVAPYEGKVLMNQVSPKLFESIALGTVLILHEGEYSGVVKPWTHFIPLKTDLSNADEVFAALGDDARLQEIADRAYADVIGSGRWSYRTAMQGYDSAVESAATAKSRTGTRNPFLVMLGSEAAQGGDMRPEKVRLRIRLRDMVTTVPLPPTLAASEVGFAPLWLMAARRIWKALKLGDLLRWLERRRGT